ncbi:phosphonate C-P lyase system protein PhnH [Fodinicurvata halophila]|uniref:Phosphonate C-P lyase system protein PhnH n=1 Tax=Fodinicurvata halophila TaxID=1419723 RepID=A0ABV8ULW1_9PROT
MSMAQTHDRGMTPGFADEVFEAQVCFRRCLEAFSFPGHLLALPVELAPPAPMNPAAAACLLTLADLDTPVWLDHAAAETSAIADFLRFHRAVHITAAPRDCLFALVCDSAHLPAPERFALGSDEYPEASSTVLVQVEGFDTDTGPLWRGPGIKESVRLWPRGLPETFLEERRAMSELFPRGLDYLFTCGRRLAALPRTTRLED